jgi:trehalose synthase
VGDDVIAEIYRLARPLHGKRVLHINSTYYGGGVAEILSSLVPLLNCAGIDADWRTLRGTPEFFNATKRFHNALQGASIQTAEITTPAYLKCIEEFASYCKIDADCVIVHDPQPLPLIRFYKKRQHWIWRCHIDLSHPNEDLWQFLTGFILAYDGIIVSDEKYVRPELPLGYTIIDPAIDPLSSKNREISEEERMAILKNYGVPMDKPLITQISRFDKWKDPVNVIEVYKRVRRECDCRLVLCGSMATDDPEGWECFEKTRSAAGSLLDEKEIILLTVDDNLLVNALQSASAVIVQKSLREGFGLTVTEALWKGKPVVASNVGGIPRQVIDDQTGFLVEPLDIQGCAEIVSSIIKQPTVGSYLGMNGKEHVRKKFLITRHVIDDLKLLGKLFA